MFRITNFALNSKVLLYRCHPTELQLASISRFPQLYKKYKPAERETCPPPPPPLPPPPPDQRLLWGTITLMVLAGGFAVYARESPEVRDWLSMNAPWFDDFIAILYQENMTFKEFATKSIQDIKNYATKGDTDTTPRKCNLDGQPVEPPQKVIVIQSGDNAGEICDIIPPPVPTHDICDIEKCLKEFCEIIVANYITARDACAYYNKEVEETMIDFSLERVLKLHDVKAERIELVDSSITNVKDATAKLDELARYFDCGVKAPPQELENTRSLMKDCRDRIQILDAEYQWQRDKSLALDVLWSEVEVYVNRYVNEVTTLIPGLDFKSKKPAALMQGDPDLLLYHTYRYINQLENELAEGNVAMTQRVDRAVASLPDTPAKAVKARNSALRAVTYEKQKKMNAEFAKRLADQYVANDKALKDALKKQLERHEENMQVKLVQKEKEATIKLNKMVADKVAQEKRNFAHQLEEMALKLKLVEDKLNERLKAERETRRSQQLWVAGASLLDATKKGGPVVKVDKEIRAIENASGDGDKLVQTVLRAIPLSVKLNGVVPESVLRERYKQMETVAMRVALVEADGAPLPVYILSFLQSIFLFMKLSGIPRAEIEKPPQEPSKDLDTFDLLQRARYWIERGNLAIALRYINALEGASRAAAAWWYVAAREHLETRQAAEAVLAHAVALGLQYI